MINVVCQFYLLNRFLLPHKASAKSFTEFLDFNVWRDINTGNSTWKESGLFPRVTLCDFEVKSVGQSVYHTVQCVLMINLFTEKAFIVLWAWYLLLSTLTFINVINWACSLFNIISTEQFINNHLEMSGHPPFSSEVEQDIAAIHQRVRKFITKYLKTDGMFILWLIAQHSDVVFTTDLIYEMWNTHSRIEEQRQIFKATNTRWNALVNRRMGTKANKSDFNQNLISSVSDTALKRNSRSSMFNTSHTLKRTASAETLPTESNFGSTDSDDYYDTFNVRHHK